MNTSNYKSDFVHVNGIRLHYLDWGGEGSALIPDGHHYCFMAQEQLVYDEMQKILLE